MSSGHGEDAMPMATSFLSNTNLVEEPERIPLDRRSSKAESNGDKAPHTSKSLKHHHTNFSKRLSGRLATSSKSNPYLHSLPNTNSIGPTIDPVSAGAISDESKGQDHVWRPNHANRIISQVAEWLQKEKAKQANRKATRGSRHHIKLASAAEVTKEIAGASNHGEGRLHHNRFKRSSSDRSDIEMALAELEQILFSSLKADDEEFMTQTDDKLEPHSSHRKFSRRSSKLLRRKISLSLGSDSETREDELIPSAEVILDNSKTIGYTGGSSTSQMDLNRRSKRVTKEQEAWLQFKSEIVRLTHTLKISGWRSVPIEQGKEIEIERLSGALTNAVYVVSPPKSLVQAPAATANSTTSMPARKHPRKLLLRVYGPQVEHLIDRENELQILHRLARKQIGPTLLGTFANGRFEQYLHARTLTAEDIREADTSKQIAKRMRELHDGIELLKEEREGGAFVWRNWDKWQGRCEEVIQWLDAELISKESGASRSKSEAWRERGLVCGVEWCVFRQAVRDYRDWLKSLWGGDVAIKQGLVFAHNDTQYGNLMRMEPSGESPLLLPENSHKQLQVIDFEYASANPRGLEFANHFTEWCYDYHDAAKPYALREKLYPTVEEQRRFLKAYVQHNPPIQARPSPAPRQKSSFGPSSSISSFVLDSRGPPTQYSEEERKRDEDLEDEVERLRFETRVWRIANSAQWVAWGIVQAKVPGMDEALEAQKKGKPSPKSVFQPNGKDSQLQLGSDPLSPEGKDLALDAQSKRPEDNVVAEEDAGEGEEEHFDYLGYAQERALFFWGDVLQLDIVKGEQLPAELLEKIKIVEY